MGATKRVLVCLSGGVDSAIAALLLQKEGFDVAGITFWLWSFPGAPDWKGENKCCSLAQAALTARELGIPHQTIDISNQFYHLIIKDFIARYRIGETPNPCGRCNRHLRFAAALHYAKEGGFDFVATGHHVRLVNEKGQVKLYKGVDRRKDQTYFLYGLRQPDLHRLLFPVGELTKQEVFTLADKYGLSAAVLPESQDLCFAFEGDYTFLFSDADLQPGKIIDQQGKVLGRHTGLPRYTIGQRRGLGITADRPLYVVKINAAANQLIVGEESELYTKQLHAVGANFLSSEPIADGTYLHARIRYRTPAVPARFNRIAADQFTLLFDRPQRAIAPGQLVALYQGDSLLGGGTISTTT
ncbi:tRNA 2-thiouridine(34) synthase MnmA [Candidatus Acetothermia bacterium]|jgi:tRNA-specific 2-thiouridylase|nr:tRNA 2-thiouridine(34) synthase MnmA [Candidatus Acetothermia bacterium]MCI2427428.1 tRNA 2-thiouridine(34) synthase MnmA [Candidatus Acetothermia bacterium]MCI2428704.1 tRNA 2-thiouridine(34) synthase MnmA [Candidatus Acetothermia bacterium]